LRAHDLGRRFWIAALLAPALLIVSAFVILPLASAFLYSLYSWNGLARGPFSGLENFRLVLTQEPFASWTYRALLHNAVVFVALMAVQNGAAFLLAFLLLKALPGHRFHRVAIFLPVVLSSVIVGAMWKLFLNPIFGLVNQALVALGFASLAQPWLGQPSTALGSLVLVNAWHWLGFPALVYLAGMQRISRESLEAARLDGASDWQMDDPDRLAARGAGDHRGRHPDLHRLLQLVRDPLRDDRPRRLARRRDGRARPLLLPHRLRQPDGGIAGFRASQRARRPDVHRHRGRIRGLDAGAAPPGDSGVIR
jgi:ABC-type spermidine/putrescine transport system permease subunit I